MDWGRPYVTALTVNRLAQRDVDAMIDRVVGNKLIPANIRRDIIEHTDGIPLFVEEMTKAVLEAENEDEARRTAAAVPSPALAVPASLHASLMARLDRLGSAKEVAQIGAALGPGVLPSTTGCGDAQAEAELVSALDRLAAAGLLFRQGVPPHANYLFKHALVQDAAYGTLLREPRRALHARIAEILESQFLEIAESQPELLARHCSEAGLTGKAAGLWGKAGQRSLERSALVEAVAQFTRGLAQIGALPGTPELRREQIKLQVALINPLIHIKGPAAPESEAAIERAHLLIEQAEAVRRASGRPAAAVLCPIRLLDREPRGVQQRHCARACRAVPGSRREARATVPLMIGHRLLGTSWLLRRGPSLKGRHTSIARSRSTTLWSIVRWRRDLATTSVAQRCAFSPTWTHALGEAREIGQYVASLMHTLGHVPFTFCECGSRTKAKLVVDELAALADEKGTVLWKALAMIEPRLAFAALGWQSRTRCSQHHLRPERVAVNGRQSVDTFLLVIGDRSLCGNRSIR